jgi:secreted PhoX family phosphatase
VLDNPDNITVSPRGGIILCEDGDRLGQRLIGLTPQGETFPFAENNVVLEEPRNDIPADDYRGREWAGATFSPDSRWLFVNIQTPGITFAITGPWDNGAL